MSEQLPPLVSHESLRVITAAAQVGEVSSDVLSFLSASAEYHLLDVVNDASNFRARGKRSRLTVDDVNASLEMRGAESSLVFSGGVAGLRDDASSRGGGTVIGADSKVDLRQVANASLPVCPIEPGFEMHWLAVDGLQPLLPQNPIPSSARGGEKGGKRGRARSGSGAGGGNSVQARLSEELTTYLRRCCEAVLSRDEVKRGRALTSLRNDPGLQQLLPHLCTFIQTKVTEYLKKGKDPDQLAALLQMLQCLLSNNHFAFLEIYLDRLLPPVMSCLLHKDFERRGLKAGSEEGSWAALSARGSGTGAVLPPKWTHWKVRDFAAEILRSICDTHGQTYPTLQARASGMFCAQVANSNTALTTLYGAIKGLACLDPRTIDETLWPRIDSLAVRISQAREAAVVKQDTEGVVKANQCLLALLQATGSATITAVDKLFTSRGKASPIVSGTKAAVPPSRASLSKSGSTQSASVATKSSAGQDKTKDHSSGTATADVDAAVPVSTGMNKSGSASNGTADGAAGTGAKKASAKVGKSVIHPRRRAGLRQRLDRSLYPVSNNSSTSSKEATRQESSTGSAGDKAVTGLNRKEQPVSTSGVSSRKEAAQGEGSALDEVMFPWYVVGLKRNGKKQGRWLTSRYGLSV